MTTHAVVTALAEGAVTTAGSSVASERVVPDAG